MIPLWNKVVSADLATEINGIKHPSPAGKPGRLINHRKENI